MHRVFKFNQKAWQKSYIDINTELKQMFKNCLWKRLCQTDQFAVFGKALECVGNHRDIKFITTETKMNHFVSKLNCQKNYFP